jgi:hypothetical protein
MIVPNWQYNPAKKFKGSLLKGDYGNLGYSHNPHLSPYESLSHKQRRHFIRFVRNLCEQVKLNTLRKLDAIKLIREKHWLGLKDALDLFNEVFNEK